MFPNFAELSPEVNAATLSTGPGPRKTMAPAAEAWKALSDKLYHACSDMNRALVALTGAWQSPAATQMMTAAAAYLVWLQGVAGHAKEIADNASLCAVAYWQAIDEMVPPRTIAENRIKRTMLANNNVFGQHTAAITTADHQYQQYWDRNAEAMYRYADTITRDGPVEPFAQAPQIINEQGLADVSEAWLSQQQG